MGQTRPYVVGNETRNDVMIVVDMRPEKLAAGRYSQFRIAILQSISLANTESVFDFVLLTSTVNWMIISIGFYSFTSFCQKNPISVSVLHSNSPVFLWQTHPLYPFLLLLNRDEYHNRPTRPLTWWGSGNQILGGRDEQAGGTWLACTRDGKIAFLTNVRELKSTPKANSRGDLPVNFLKSNKSPKEFAEDLAKEADKYNGFNLILVDIYSKSMVYITNRPKAEHNFVTNVSPGMHVLSNANLDAPWPKAERLGHSFKALLDKYGETELPVNEMVETLMMNSIKDDESFLPKIYSAEFEYQLSSIFVETDTALGRYGTRSTSVLSVKSCGDVNFYERHLEKETWHEHAESFQLEKMMKSKGECREDEIRG